MSAARELRLGTRGSQLALWQAKMVAAGIAERGGPACRIAVIKTSGDRLQDAPLSEVGGKRLFVKEIEDALLRDEIDLAVHSSKDMPASLPAGLAIGAVLPREDPHDAVILPEVRLKADPTRMIERAGDPVGSGFRVGSGVPVGSGVSVGSGFSRIISSLDDLVATLGRSPSIGTGSVRRIAQLSRLFPGARFTPIRGNLDTRLRKLDAGEHDALVLAAAGLRRLGFESRITFTLPARACVPAPGQGIVAVEIRDDDVMTRGAVEAIDNWPARAALTAERAVVTALGGGCQTPVGALASVINDELDVVAVVISVDGARAVHAHGRAPATEAAALGHRLAAELIGKGAADILAEAQHTPGAVQGLQP